jgi:hypothetical protein
MQLDASFVGPPPTDYFSLYASPRFQRPAFIEPAPPVNPAMTSVDRVAPWLEQAQERLEWIATLKPNWDGYGAAAVSKETIEQALRFLLAVMPSSAVTPEIGPTKDGYIQFEWHRLTADLEIRMRSTDSYEISFDDIGNPKNSWEETLTIDLHRAVDAIREISNRA